MRVVVYVRSPCAASIAESLQGDSQCARATGRSINCDSTNQTTKQQANKQRNKETSKHRSNASPRLEGQVRGFASLLFRRDCFFVCLFVCLLVCLESVSLSSVCLFWTSCCLSPRNTARHAIVNHYVAFLVVSLVIVPVTLRSSLFDFCTVSPHLKRCGFALIHDASISLFVFKQVRIVFRTEFGCKNLYSYEWPGTAAVALGQSGVPSWLMFLRRKMKPVTVRYVSPMPYGLRLVSQRSKEGLASLARGSRGNCAPRQVQQARKALHVRSGRFYLSLPASPSRNARECALCVEVSCNCFLQSTVLTPCN